MANIKEKILADARTHKPRYADRMEVVEPQLEDLPAGLTHYSIQISQLFDYLPINYIVIGEDYYTSLQKGDFARLIKRMKFAEEKKFSATDFAILFLLIAFSSRDRRLVEKIEDIALAPEVKESTREKLSQILSRPVMKRLDKEIESTFFCFNNRTNSLEQFVIRVNPNYEVESESSEVLSFD